MLVPVSVWSDLETLFGVSDTAKQLLVDVLGEDGEGGIGNKVCSDLRWVKHIVFDSRGQWDLANVQLRDRTNYTSYFAELVLRLVQPICEPDYSKWLPDKDRPFFTLDIYSIGKVSRGHEAHRQREPWKR